jgi:hypothetical protein
MENSGEEQEFEILGIKVRFKPDSTNKIPAGEIIDTFLKEATKIKNGNINLKEKDMVTLVALKFISEKLELEKEYKGKVSDLQNVATNALNIIETISPSNP